MQKEAYGMLRRWETLRPAEALQLLDPTFWELCATAAKGFTPDKGCVSISSVMRGYKL